MTKLINKIISIDKLFTISLSNGDNKPSSLPFGKKRLVSSGASNNGIVGRFDTNTKLYPKWSLTCDMFGNCFVQKHDFVTVSHGRVNILLWKNAEYAKPLIALYVATAINRVTQTGKYGFSNMLSSKRIKSLDISLPVTDSGQLDVQYMEQYIKRVEVGYTKRVEAYLATLGCESLDDCELSSQDLKVLSGPDEWGEFKIGNLFDEIQIGRKYVRNELSPRGQTPVYSSVEENGGILGYINNQAEFELDVSHPYIVFGDHTRTMQIPDNDFSVADNVKVLRGKHAYSVKQLLYIMTCFKKVIPNLGYSRHWTTAKELSFYLPVYGDGSIAYDYMDCYITAVEKKKVLLLKQHLDKRLDLYQRAIKK